ncbi:MAG: DUF1416 domain-containing protein [Armatimonadetes bacterium]|nr:DUF1416 domain-containing protein [Armatimonadota bacterium]
MKRVMACTVAAVLVAGLAAAGDQVTLLGRYYSPAQNHTTYSYMLRIDGRSLQVGDTFQLAHLAPVKGVGDPLYWRRDQVVADGNGSTVVWKCVRQPGSRVRIFATFDVIVHGRAGVDFVEQNIAWGAAVNGSSTDGVVIGPVPIGGWIPTGSTGSVSGIVFYDADEDGQHDPDELLLEGIAVQLLDSNGRVVAQTNTDQHGAFKFTDVAAGAYTVRILLPETEQRYTVVTTGNADGQPVEVVQGQEAQADFGLSLNLETVQQDLGTAITGGGLSPGYWRHQVLLAIYQAAKSGECPVPPDAIKKPQPPREDIPSILAAVERLWVSEPFQFEDGYNDEPVGCAGLWQALQILSPGNSSPGEDSRMSWQRQLMRQLLAAEMNYASGRTSSLGRLEGWLLWFAEWAVNNPDAAQATQTCQWLISVLDGLNNLGEGTAQPQ